ncbi:MAG TPA: histidine phosphatase family protein [Candidatus Binataceae bacterium]|nr:histidine phosphatase family protein [Candidatus Binataceae bacterium]
MPNEQQEAGAPPATTGKFIMVRHGESEGNRERRFTISSEVPLTELGRQQAREVARAISRAFNPSIVISSPFRRARQTSEIISGELNLEIEIVNDLHERDLGCLKGHSYDDLRTLVLKDPAYDPARGWLWRPDGGESYDDVRQRVVSAVEGLLARYPAQEIIIVSHGGVMLSVWAHIIGQWQGAHLPPNCGIVLVEHDGRRMQPPRIIQGRQEGELG